jgi:ribonuclease BN (tRNA processing enzyme)
METKLIFPTDCRTLNSGDTKNGSGRRQKMDPLRISGRLSVSARSLQLIICFLSCAFFPSALAQPCGSQGVAVEVLGSGGPELQDRRASSSYLVWENGQARVLVDAGGGSALRFGQSGAQVSQLDVILFTHFHVDHSADFPALIKSSWFEDRKRPLPIYGPLGNDLMPSATEFVSDFFGGKRGAYRYLSELLVPAEKKSYKMQPHNVAGSANPVAVFRSGDLAVHSVRVIHGPVPALAWRVEVGGELIVFSGDTNGKGEGLVRLATNADLFVAHNAVPEGATGMERNLHMPPSVIGQIAGDAQVKHLVLSHRMLRTLGKENQTQSEIKKRFSGPLEFANDLDCFPLR